MTLSLEGTRGGCSFKKMTNPSLTRKVVRNKSLGQLKKRFSQDLVAVTIPGGGRDAGVILGKKVFQTV